jgi:glycogen(starch) synthase
MRRAAAGRDLRVLHRVLEDIRELKHSFGPSLELIYASGANIAIQQMANRGPEVPTITSIQGSPRDLIAPGGSMERLLHRSAAVLAVSDYVRRGVCEAVPEVADRVHLLPTCLPVPELMPTPLPMNPPVILCLGRLVPEKGFDVALRALAFLDGHWSRVPMIVAGDGSERSALESLAAELGLARRVTFTGWVEPEAVPALINGASFVVVPSRWQEAFALVNLQAAQMGRAIVATRVGGNPEGVIDGETGLLVDNEDVKGMAGAMVALVDDPERMAAMGNRGRQRMLEQFGFDAYIEWHLELFRRHAISE